MQKTLHDVLKTCKCRAVTDSMCKNCSCGKENVSCLDQCNCSKSVNEYIELIISASFKNTEIIS